MGPHAEGDDALAALGDGLVQAYGPDHPHIAIRLSNLAAVLKDLALPAAARPLFERALAIDEKTYDPDHPTIARRLFNLAMLLKALALPADACPLLERALTIAEKTLPITHPLRRPIAANLKRLRTELSQS